ncbi:Ribose import ATP-binding protein RbsA [Methylobacterium adhaesivum]|uniref:ABC transporter ATP-binding protein n=1 Tax=Methylobacterium adhaesivum TaxID=333297 RepID=A0ABT8BKV4_9HYPH|nr:ABC transporter ATP-binding protein [Methylobacterium adhaesivum]MDN3591819.1 ABC transporter ATP-binding protein [Methylobacterium adhaesivum]GJD32157.1 Ribose import ATP-binding protein RbsA [Methylobacterium adhaesivum]
MADIAPAPPLAIGVETIGMTKRFGAHAALDDVSMKIERGGFHALLGENGAGKSTLVKCVMGFYAPTSGTVLLDGREAEITNPRGAQARGLGMVYQHFTLVPSLTGAENLVIARADAPAILDWRAERAALADFMARMPFRLNLDRPVAELAAGEKQKLEIVKQLYLKARFLILDEPTSVLTPAEAEEVLGLLRAMTDRGTLTVLMISHKFREVETFARSLSVLRRGRLVGGGAVGDLSRGDMAALMIGERTVRTLTTRTGSADTGRERLRLEGVTATDPSGLRPIAIDSLRVCAREIVGIAGVSGNGQKELADVLGGQIRATGGRVTVAGAPYAGTRAESRSRKVRFIPEEPLRNACVPRMSVAENLALRAFDRRGDDSDRPPTLWLDKGAMARRARDLIARFGVKTASADAPIATLSGGNVQRAVLARELTDPVDLLIVVNPCFGLDFAAVSEIRNRIVAARNAGAAVLLISEDLDEILELSDRILVMSDGRLVYETPAAAADVATIGRHMAGHH